MRLTNSTLVTTCVDAQTSRRARCQSTLLRVSLALAHLCFYRERTARQRLAVEFAVAGLLGTGVRQPQWERGWGWSWY